MDADGLVDPLADASASIIGSPYLARSARPLVMVRVNFTSRGSRAPAAGRPAVGGGVELPDQPVVVEDRQGVIAPAALVGGLSTFSAVAEFGKFAIWFTFTSNRFDHRSELPPEYNAGNRFYGRDVAEFVSAGLRARGLDSSFFDEDWGWMVHAGMPDDGVLEVAVYPQPRSRTPRPRTTGL